MRKVVLLTRRVRELTVGAVLVDKDVLEPDHGKDTRREGYDHDNVLRPVSARR